MFNIAFLVTNEPSLCGTVTYLHWKVNSLTACLQFVMMTVGHKNGGSLENSSLLPVRLSAH